MDIGTINHYCNNRNILEQRKREIEAELENLESERVAIQKYLMTTAKDFINKKYDHALVIIAVHVNFNSRTVMAETRRATKNVTRLIETHTFDFRELAEPIPDNW